MSDLGNQSELLTVRQSVRAAETGWFKRGLAARDAAENNRDADGDE